MTSIGKCIKTLEKLSLLTCSNEVLPLLERTLANVEPILKVKTESVKPLLWQNSLDIDRLHNDEPQISLSKMDLKKNAPEFFEDYIVVGNKLKLGHKENDYEGK